MLSLMLALTLQFQPITVNATPRHWTFKPVVVKASAYHAIRARLSAGDDGGTIYLDGGPSVYTIAGFEERGECEWVGPRLDGTDVRVCAGSVVAVRLGSDERQATR